MAEGSDKSIRTVQVPKDDHLTAIEDGIMAGLPEDYRDDMERIVISGRQILFNKKTHKDVMDGLRDVDDENDARKVALGVAGILTIINRESGGKIPVQLMVPAGVLVTVEVIRFLNDAEMLPTSPEFTGNAMEELFAALMQKMGMGKEKAPPQQQAGPVAVPPEQGVPQGMPPQGLVA